MKNKRIGSGDVNKTGKPGLRAAAGSSGRPDPPRPRRSTNEAPTPSPLSPGTPSSTSSSRYGGHAVRHTVSLDVAESVIGFTVLVTLLHGLSQHVQHSRDGHKLYSPLWRSTSQQCLARYGAAHHSIAQHSIAQHSTA